MAALLLTPATPRKRRFFYYLGLLYGAIFITAGSICMSCLEVFIIGSLIITLISLIGMVTSISDKNVRASLFWICCLVLQLCTALIIQTVITSGIAAAASLPMTILILGSVLPVVAVCAALGYTVCKLGYDFLNGIPDVARNFYNYDLHHSVMKALLSPGAYFFIQRMMLNFRSNAAEEEIITVYVDHINYVRPRVTNIGTIHLTEIPAKIVMEYLYGELVNLGRRLFPVFFPIWLEGETLTLSHLKGAWNKESKDWETARQISREVSLSQAKGEQRFSSHIMSHGFIKRKLQLITCDAYETKTNDFVVQPGIAYLCPKVVEKKGQFFRQFNYSYTNGRGETKEDVVEREQTDSLDAYSKDDLEKRQSSILKTLSRRGYPCFHKPKSQDPTPTTAGPATALSQNKPPSYGTIS